MEYMSFEDNDIKQYVLDLLLQTPALPALSNLPCRTETIDYKLSYIDIPLMISSRSYAYCLRYQYRRDHISICRLDSTAHGKTVNYFYNETRLRYFIDFGISAVMFTDNIIVASHFSDIWPWREMESRLFWVWTSLWPSDGPLDSWDWTIFKKKTIFYYLACHSGLTIPQTWDNAKRILEKLKSANGDEVKVFFVYYAQNERFPLFMTEEMFLKNFEEVQQIEPSPSLLSDFLWIFNDISSVQRDYMVPLLIYEHTATLFVAGKLLDRTRLLLDLAVSVSQGKHFLPSLPKNKSAHEVAYIHENLEGIDFRSELRASILRHCPTIRNSFEDEQINTISLDTLNSFSPFLNEKIWTQYPILKTKEKINCVGNNLYYVTFSPKRGYDLNIIIRVLFETIPASSKLVVIDIPYLFQLVDHAKAWAEFNYQLMLLRARHTVIIGAEIYFPRIESNVLNMPFDKIFRLQRLSAKDPEQIVLNIRIERSDTPIDGRIKKSFTLARGIAPEGPGWTQCRQKVLLKSDIHKLILRSKNKTAKHLAIIAGVSESYIKKIKRELGLTKPMPSRAPKNPHRKPPQNPYGPLH